jgi:hypothetical protein
MMDTLICHYGRWIDVVTQQNDEKLRETFRGASKSGILGRSPLLSPTARIIQTNMGADEGTLHMGHLRRRVIKPEMRTCTGI